MTKNLQMRINCKIYLTYFSHRQFSIVFSNQSRPCLPPASTDWLKLVQKERKYNHHPWQMHGRSKAEGLTQRRGKLNFLDQLTWLYKWVEKFCFMKNEHRHTTLSSFCEISTAFKERAKLGGQWKPFFLLHFSNSLDSITNLKSFFSGAKLHWKGYLLSVFWCSIVRFCGLSGICLMEQKHTQSCPWEMLCNNINAGSLPALPLVTSCLSLCVPQHFLEHLPIRILSQPSHCLWVLWKVSFPRQGVHKPPLWDHLGRPYGLSVLKWDEWNKSEREKQISH